MNKLAWIVCNSFLNKTGPKKKNSLVRFLPKSEQEIIKTVENETLKTITCNFDDEKTLKLVHHSWHASFLRSLSETEVGLFLSCLPPFVSEKLKKVLLYSRPLDNLSSISEKYFRSILLKNLFNSNQDVLPLECLGDSRLKELLSLSSEQLHTLVEFLGLHDLSVEIKQIIDTSLLKKIQSALTVEKDSYLKNLSQKKEPVLFKRIDLNKWDGKTETLDSVIFYRGTNRLAKALYDENTSFQWYISRMLSVSEAVTFQSLCKPLEHPRAGQLLSNQVLELIPQIIKLSPQERI